MGLSWEDLPGQMMTKARMLALSSGRFREKALYLKKTVATSVFASKAGPAEAVCTPREQAPLIVSRPPVRQLLQGVLEIQLLRPMLN